MNLSTDPSAATTSRPPRLSATVVVVRDAPAGIEVLLLQRAERGDHNSGAWVFPGGIVDAGDGEVAACCVGLDDAAADARLGLSQGGLSYHVAAVRECFEEAGLLLAVDAQGAPVEAARVAALQPLRVALHRGDIGIAEFCRAQGLRLALDRLAYLSHWVTPRGRAKRFDTRFFVAALPAGQEARHDGSETVAQAWLKPADVLADGSELKLVGPTRATLAALARFDSVASLWRWLDSPREVPRIEPRLATGSSGERPVPPWEPAWAEIGRLDPEGHGQACYEIQPGVPVRLSAHVWRLTAHNGSAMTGPGTNSYFVGGGPRDQWALIDPGPLEARHVEALLAHAPGTVTTIFTTHTHVDHSPAVAPLAARTGARVVGRVATHPMWQDASFAPQHQPADGERFEIDEGITLRAVHTPGHASNHVCWLFEEEATLFTGDHVMQGSTVVINPPDGDMAAYVDSLRRLAAELGDTLQWLAPGHGFLMAEPRRAFEALVAHRLKREAKVVDALRDLGPAPIEVLLAQVYDDVPERLHGVATRSLLAHLRKLQHEDRAAEAGGAWSWLQGA